jgi:hypothetical protein
MLSSPVYAELDPRLTGPPIRVNPFLATHPDNAPITPVFATHPKTRDLKFFVCHTSEKQGGVPGAASHSPVPSTLSSLFALFTPRVFDNFFPIKRFRTLSQNCRVYGSRLHQSLKYCFTYPVNSSPAFLRLTTENCEPTTPKSGSPLPIVGRCRNFLSAWKRTGDLFSAFKSGPAPVAKTLDKPGALSSARFAMSTTEQYFPLVQPNY